MDPIPELIDLIISYTDFTVLMKMYLVNKVFYTVIRNRGKYEWNTYIRRYHQYELCEHGFFPAILMFFLYCKNPLDQFENHYLESAVKGHQTDMAEFLMSIGADANIGMETAIRYKHKDLMKYFIKKGANDWNKGMESAALIGDIRLVQYFIRKGASNWYVSIGNAALGNSKPLVDLFLRKRNRMDTTYEMNEKGLWGAARGGHKELIDFFISRENFNYVSYKHAMYASFHSKKNDIIIYLMEVGNIREYHWEAMMKCAAEHNNLEMAKYIVSKANSVTNLNFITAALRAYQGGHTELGDYLKQKAEAKAGMKLCISKEPRDNPDNYLVMYPSDSDSESETNCIEVEN